MSDVTSTIEKLKAAVRDMVKQATGEKDVKPFLDTICEAAGVDDVDALVSDFFNTDSYNDDWIALVTDDEAKKNESTTGVRLRLSIAYLCSWKKAILRLGSQMSNVDRLDGTEIGLLNSAYDSLNLTGIKLTKKESGDG